ncbi:bifunctional aspartate transaminase/aspartate 4-decarboxylase [Mycoplasma sp. P36-A1]|uniref:bifunctional aspartate transaminase/aspartate 4-decarboxylase n=1 Tax=Mycoplasma sp. P36-A1 TaxID=3252900 RepID=UPI003C2C65A6
MKQNIDNQKFEGLGAFEISFEMLKLAEKNEKNNIFLNAGRGNPNWINTKARLAFSKLVEFGIKDSLRTINEADMAGYTQLVGIRERFEAFLEPEENETDQFLEDAINYLKDDLSLDLDETIKELVDGAIGNNYPVPSRCLKNSEIILNQFLQSTLYNGVELADKTQVFPTEGGTAAIVYLFNSLKRNKLIKPGDKIAINTPIFTPYLQIPELAEYELEEVFISSTADNDWDISIEELDKLADPDIKAFFMVNPSNPGSKALSEKALNEIKKVVEKNKDLMIITDDVYGTFVDEFQTIYSVVPYNTILVYSYSKLYGATGWRVGMIAMNEDNVYDKLISDLSEEDKSLLDKRYDIVTHSVQSMPFLERIVADSRAVGLYHTSGLSTPQQIMEVLFSLTHLVAIKLDKKDNYINASNELVYKRYEDLHAAMKYPGDDTPSNAKYYSLINIYDLAETKYGKEFRTYLENNIEHIDFLLNLANKNGVVLMDGVGFGSAEGNLRVSQANLPTEDYHLIGKQIIVMLKEYYDEFSNKKEK